MLQNHFTLYKETSNTIYNIFVLGLSYGLNNLHMIEIIKQLLDFNVQDAQMYLVYTKNNIIVSQI